MTALTPVGAAGTVAGTRAAVGPLAALLPMALVALTVNVYDVPAVRPLVIVQLVAVAPATVQLPPAGLDVTVYPVMALPPLLAGTVQVTLTWGAAPKAMPVVYEAAPMVGAWGDVAAVTLGEGAEANPVPETLVAVTVNVYAVPAVRPDVMVQLVVAEVQVEPPGLAVTVYPVMGAPPVAGVLQDTTTCGVAP